MPSSPPLKGQSTVGTTTLGPKTHTLQPRGNVSAIQHQQPVSRSNRAQSALPNTLTPAEAYANAHHPISGTRSQREREKEKDGKGKPLFDWISRKLGGSAKRGAEGVNPHSSGSGSGTQESANGRSGPSRLQGRSNQVSQPNGLHPQSTHSSDDLTRQNSIAVSRSESHSLRSYSLSFVNTIEHERRREANNPYPSIPVPPQHRESTIDSVSLSLLSRSSSMDSSIRPRISLYDDSSVRWMGDGGADEDASIRPFPPSHQASPTPSHSILSRSVSADLLSPIIYRQRSRSSSVNRPEMPSERRIIDSAASASSRSSNDTPDDLSRRDSASTKPTTVLSFESAPRVAHIAQSHSVASSHPASPLSQTVSSGVDPNEVGLNTPTTPGSPLVASPPSPPSPTMNLVQAPKHSHPHPRDNPRPSSPPRDNASTVTLASSTFNLAPTPIGPSTPAVPGPSTGRFRDLAAPLPQGPFIRPGSIISSPSVTFAPETMGDSTRPVSIFNYGQGDAFAGGSSYTPSLNAVSLHGIAPSISIRTGWTGRGDRVADSNASVKAIRRKGSWESYQSGWSWRAAQQLDDTANMPPVEGGEDTGVQLCEGMFSPLNGSVGNASKSLQSDSTAESMSQPQYQPIHDRDDSEGDGGGFARNGYNTIWNGQMSLDLIPPLRPDRSKTSLRESPMPKDGYGSGHGAYHHHAEESDYDETPGIGLKRFSLGSASPVTA